MRKLQQHLERELGKERVILVQQWEHLVKEMGDYGNHRRFLCRFLSAGITPGSIRLKNILRMSRSFEIIRKAEKHLLNQRISAINNTISTRSWESDTCVNQ